jgi:hypothetical protein
MTGFPASFPSCTWERILIPRKFYCATFIASNLRVSPDRPAFPADRPAAEWARAFPSTTWERGKKRKVAAIGPMAEPQQRRNACLPFSESYGYRISENSMTEYLT